MGVLASADGSGGAGAARGFSASGMWLWTAALAAVAANTLTSFQPLASARAASLWCAYAFVFFLCCRLETPVAGRRVWSPRGVVIAAVIAAGTGLALHGLYQSLYSFDRLVQAAGPEAVEALRARLASGRAVATLGLPAALAGFLALSLPLSVGWARRPGRRGVEQTLAWLIVLIQAAGLAAARSAAGLLSVAMSGALMCWWSLRGNHRARGRMLAALMIAVGLAGAAALMALRLSASTSMDEGGGPFALRLGNWEVAMRVFAEHPVMGVGAGCYGIAFPQHRTWEMNESKYAHNSYLQLISEGGIVLGAAAVILALAFFAALRRRVASGDHPGSAYLAAACLSFLLHNIADFTFYLPTVGFAFFSLAGLACGPAQRRGACRAGSRIFVTAAALGLAAFALVVTRADLQKEEALRLAAGDQSLAPTVARNAVRANPLDPDSHSVLSHVLLDEGIRSGDEQNLIDAEEEARRAVDLDPHTPHHWHHLGRVRLARRDPLGAYAALTRAAQLYPIKMEYRRDRDAVAAALERREETK